MNSFLKKSIVLLILVLFSTSLTFGNGKKESTDTNYPQKPITIIVPSNAGGGTDTMARLIAQFAEKYFPQPFVIVNKPGASGQIGFELIGQAKKDGYTIGAGFTPHLMAHVSAGRAKYTLDSFLPIANVVTDPGVLVVRTDSPFNSLKEIVNAEKNSPASLTAATTGPGGDDFFALSGFNTNADIAIRDVPSKGSSEQKTQILGGHVDMAFMNYSQIESNVNAGDLKILAVMTTKRLPYNDQLPTFTELGYNITSDSSRGFIAPAGIPDNAHKSLAKLFNQILNDPEFIKASEGMLLLNILGPEEYSDYLEGLQKTTDIMFSEYPW